MIAKITSAILNWVLASLIMPGVLFVYDVIRLRRENKELKKAVEELKSAKTLQDKINASNNIP